MKLQPIKILADGTFLKPGNTRTDHVAVLLPEVGILVHTKSLTNADGTSLKNWDTCVAACANLQLLGLNGWELASRDDWNAVLDLTHHDPAVDTSLFPGIKSAWHWTSTPAAGSASSAWLVGAGNGYVGALNRSSGGFALAVRRVGQ